MKFPTFVYSLKNDSASKGYYKFMYNKLVCNCVLPKHCASVMSGVVLNDRQLNLHLPGMQSVDFFIS